MKLDRDAVEFIQSACNPVAVARQFAEWCKDEWYKDGQYHDIRDNALLCGVLGKLCDMFSLNHDGNRAYRYMNENQDVHTGRD